MIRSKTICNHLNSSSLLLTPALPLISKYGPLKKVIWVRLGHFRPRQVRSRQVTSFYHNNRQNQQYKAHPNINQYSGIETFLIFQ